MSIKLFTKPACMQCNATKKALDRAGLDYEVVDISLDPAAREYVLSLGYMQAPVVEVDGDILIRCGKEQVAVHEQRGMRDLPRKIDRRCIRWQGRRDGIVIGLPIERVSAKVAEHRGGRVREGIRGGELTVGGRCKETP